MFDNKIKRVAFYARVSTDDKGQDADAQLLELREYASRSGWEITKEYKDEASGKNGERSQFKAMLKDATRRRFDAVVVWALDRFTREGIGKTFGYLDTLTENGVAFISFTEEHFRTNGPVGELLIAIFSWVAKQERARLIERTAAGIANAKVKGKMGFKSKSGLKTAGCLGPRPKDRNYSRILTLRDSGMSYGSISMEIGIPRTTVARICRLGVPAT